MIFDETRDNLTDTENQIREADAHEDTRDVWAGTDIYIDEGEADHIRNSRHIRLVEEHHEEINDGANGYDDDPEDDGQPSEYEEWQDYMGGDDYYDHSENEVW